jgi:GTPase SAR1 family protein
MAQIEEKWWNELYDDPPFNVHMVRRLKDAAHMVGEAHRIYLKQFQQRYESSLASCVVTTVAGEPGTGKSFFLSHLIYKMQIKKDMPGIPIIIKLSGRNYTAKEVYHKIRNNVEYNELCEHAGIKVEYVTDEILGPEIRKEINAIRQNWPNISICLLIDNVDEYVRSNAIRYEREKNLEKKNARKEAMISLLRLINAVNDTIGTGICVVLSLTVDMVTDFNLGSFGDAKNIFTGLVGSDASLRGRFSPIYESENSEKLHLFSGITLRDAYEMTHYYMEGWFNRHRDIQQKQPKECVIGRFNLYPFTVSAIKLLHEASTYPGEIVLGCLSALQRFCDFQNEIQSKYPEFYRENSIITDTYAALGILQMSDYFRNVKDNDEFISRLKDIIGTDPEVLYLHVFPQCVERIQLAEIDIMNHAGQAFLDFLGRIGLGDEYEPIQLTEKFIRTRGKVKYPDFPTVDCVFRYEDENFGVQFISENFLQLNKSKLSTSCYTIKKEAVNDIREEDFLDKMIFVCIVRGDLKKNQLVSEILKSINHRPLGDESSLFSIQERDYRPRVSVAIVDEETVWYWKTLSQTEGLTDDQKNLIALTMEDVYHIDWVINGTNVGQEHKKNKWGTLLDRLLQRTDIPSPKEKRGIIPEYKRGGWER